MAEFVEVFRQMRRMCESLKAEHGCEKCPFDDDWCSEYGLNIDYDTAQRVEDDVMSWAAKNPEPKPIYPTFAEWQKETFPDGIEPIRPCTFMSIHKHKCFDMSCGECAETTHIPPDVAEKLGIKPKEEGHETD